MGEEINLNEIENNFKMLETTFGFNRLNVVYQNDKKNLTDITRYKGAEFLNYLKDIETEIGAGKPFSAEQTRLFALAYTAIEEATMWSIKAINK